MNIKTTTLLYTCLALFSYTHAQSPAENKRTISSFFTVLNNHDSLAAAAFFDDSAKIESPNWEGAVTGKSGATTVYGRYFRGTPDLTFTVTNMVAEEHMLVAEYTFAGTFSNPEAGTPAYMKNKYYTLKGSARFNFKNGKIVYAVHYFDQVAFLRQVGFFDAH